MPENAREASKLMTVKEVAAAWRQHEVTIYKKIAAGSVPYVRLGDNRGAIRIPRSALEAQLFRDHAEAPAERRVHPR
jgi:excisionase family DNA binding protein